jgi:hypothetical protein
MTTSDEVRCQLINALRLDLVGPRPGFDDDAAPEQVSARKAFFPSSMGLSVLVAQDTAQLRVRIAWADRDRHGDPR